jgi:hypothetical protein
MAAATPQERDGAAEPSFPGGTDMTAARLGLAVAAVSLALLAAACHNEEQANAKRNEVKLPPPKTMNQVSAAEKLHEAEQAENDGKFAHALECYEQLRSYPEASRPKDLDDRIKRVEMRAKAQQ